MCEQRFNLLEPQKKHFTLVPSNASPQKNAGCSSVQQGFSHEASLFFRNRRQVEAGPNPTQPMHSNTFTTTPYSHDDTRYIVNESAPSLTEARMAWLSASDPLATKTISSGVHPSSAATLFRALTTAALQALPSEWALDGFPKHSPMKGNISRETLWTRGHKINTMVERTDYDAICRAGRTQSDTRVLTRLVGRGHSDSKGRWRGLCRNDPTP